MSVPGWPINDDNNNGVGQRLIEKITYCHHFPIPSNKKNFLIILVEGCDESGFIIHIVYFFSPENECVNEKK